MKAQIYEDGMVRVFGADQHIVCDVYATSMKAKDEADRALRRVRMVRVGQWKTYRDGGFAEATVRWLPWTRNNQWRCR